MKMKRRDLLELRQDQLHIRSAKTTDAKQLADWWQDGEIMAHAGFPNGLKIDLQALENRVATQTESNELLIIEQADEAIGEMSYQINEQSATMGIKICDLSQQEKGYGTICIKLMIDYLFNQRFVTKIELDTNLTNQRAQHVYEALGFQKTAIKQDHWQNQLGEWQSTVFYELNK